jgi:thiamine-phosphate pyrophosphorylase
VAFGAFFASATKTEAAPAGLEVLQWWSELMELPCVAIGGITPENCGPIVAAGADFLAVCDAVWNHPEGPAEAVRAFNAAIGWAAAEATAAAGFPPGR